MKIKNFVHRSEGMAAAVSAMVPVDQVTVQEAPAVRAISLAAPVAQGTSQADQVISLGALVTDQAFFRTEALTKASTTYCRG
ncbi:hypothetical protein D3C85_1550900 [compost metagenome]